MSISWYIRLLRHFCRSNLLHTAYLIGVAQRACVHLFQLPVHDDGCTNHANLRVAACHYLPFYYYISIRYFTACSWHKNTSLEANDDAGIYLNTWRRRWHLMLLGFILLSWLGTSLSQNNMALRMEATKCLPYARYLPVRVVQTVLWRKRTRDVGCSINPAPEWPKASCATSPSVPRHFWRRVLEMLPLGITESVRYVKGALCLPDFF